jgi:hypothetical protein
VPFILPHFNLNCGIQTYTLTPGAPRLVVGANLQQGRSSRFYIFNSVEGATFDGVTTPWILVPKLTDVRAANLGGAADMLELPLGSGRWYYALAVDDIGKGFGNEHRFVIAAQLGPWPVPIP